MNNDLDSIFSSAHSVELTDLEHDALRTKLQAFMAEHPVRPTAPIWRMFLRPIPAVIVIGVLASGGIAFAAEGSIPGDVLYPVKVSVTEPVRSALAISAEAKATFQASLVERRLQEAEKLAEAGRLTPTVKQRLDDKVNASSVKLENRLTELENKGDDDAAANVQANIEGTFDAHEDVLRSIQSSKPSEHVDDLLNDAAKNQTRVHQDGTKTEERIGKKSSKQLEQSARARLKTARTKIDQVQKLIDRKRQRYDIAAAQAKLDGAKASLTTGQSQITAGKFFDALTTLQSALRTAQEARHLLLSAKLLGPKKGHRSLQPVRNLNIFRTRNRNESDKDHSDD